MKSAPKSPCLVVTPPSPLGLRHKYVGKGRALEWESGLHSSPAPSWTQQITGSVYWLNELIDAWCVQCSAHSRSSEIAGGPSAPSPNLFIYSVGDLEKITSLLASVSFSRKWVGLAPGSFPWCPLCRWPHQEAGAPAPGPGGAWRSGSAQCRGCSSGKPGELANSSRCKVEVDHKDR